MAAERFTIDKKGGTFYLFDNGILIPIFDGQPICDLLNTLHEENTTFREALKELKEIGDYQAMTIKELYNIISLIEDEIDKKIAVLTDAKIKSFQNEDEELFMKIKFSIQVLRELKERIKELEE